MTDKTDFNLTKPVVAEERYSHYHNFPPKVILLGSV